jgi:cysteine desulfurase family protein (TIGR01976 family)
VRFADFDPATGELTAEDVAAVVSPRTRVVAVTAASNLIGTRPDLPAIASVAHEAGALLHVDGVHATAHVPVDVSAEGADLWVCSPYKFLGPHHGVLAADPALLETLHPAKLVPSSDAVPERFELGTLPYELLAGTRAAVDFLATLGGDRAPGTTRRERLVASFHALEDHEDRLLARLEAELRAHPRIRLHSNAARRTPTLLLTFDGVDVQRVRGQLAELDINAPAGNFYAWECSHHLGLGAEGGLRIGLAPYTNDSDVDRLLEGLDAALDRA